MQLRLKYYILSEMGDVARISVVIISVSVLGSYRIVLRIIEYRVSGISKVPNI